MSRQELAEAVNAYIWARWRKVERLDATYVGHLEQGRYRWPGARRREALRAVLGAPTDTDLGFYHAPRGPVPRGADPAGRQTARKVRRRGTANGAEALPSDPMGIETPWHLPARSLADLTSHEANLAEGDDAGSGDIAAIHIRRRSLLWGLATVTTAAGFVDAGRGPRRRVGMTDVMRLTALTTLYRSMDHQYGGGGLVDDVSRFAESASRLLDHTVSDAVRPHLFAAIANARDLAGWAAFDATRHACAQRHFSAAERFAIESGDRQLVAHIRYGQAKQMQHLRHNRDALDILRIAHHQLDRPTPGLTATLRGAEAASRAAIGDWDGAHRALDQSSSAFAGIQPGNEPEWLGFLDRGELLAQYGRVSRDRARADRRYGDEAVRWVSDAIAAFGPDSVRSTVLNQVGLASAYFLADEPDLALEAGRTACRQATALISPRVTERIANLRRDAARHGHRSDVADFVRDLPRPTITVT